MVSGHMQYPSDGEKKIWYVQGEHPPLASTQTISGEPGMVGLHLHLLHVPAFTGTDLSSCVVLRLR